MGIQGGNPEPRPPVVQAGWHRLHFDAHTGQGLRHSPRTSQSMESNDCCPNDKFSSSLTPRGCPTIQFGSDTNFTQSHRTASTSDSSHKWGPRPPALLPGWLKILGFLKPQLQVWELPGTAHRTPELTHPVYRVRSGRVLRRAGASIPIKSGWPPSLHVDVFTSPQTPLVSLFQSFYQSFCTQARLMDWTSSPAPPPSPGQGPGLKTSTL